MRRFAILLLTVVVLSFAFDTERILSIYEGLVSDFNSERKEPFVAYVVSELENLSLYRFYKNKIVGSVEKREFALNIGDFLDAIYESRKSDDETENMARALFLAYVNAYLQGKNLNVSIIKKTNSFNKAFDGYGRKLRYEMYDLIRHVLAYHLGATDIEPPIDLKDLPKVDLGYTYRIRARKYTYTDDLSFYLKESDLKKAIFKAFEELSSKKYKDAPEFRRELLKKSRYLMRFFDREVADEKIELARLAVEKTPRKINIYWLRFLLYGILLIIGLKFRRAIGWMLTVILVGEGVYLFTAFDFENLPEGLLYSLLAFFPFAFAFMLILSKPKEKTAWLILGSALIVSLFIPSHVNMEKLSMSAHPELVNSPFYDLLKNDLYKSETSRFRLIVGKLSSSLSASREETRDMVRNFANFVYKLKDKEGVKEIELTPNGIYITFPKMSDYYSYRNFDTRIRDFEKMESMLGDYVAQEESRKRKSAKQIEDLVSLTERIVSYSASFLRRDFRDYVRNTFEKKPVLTPVLDEVDPIFDRFDKAKSPSVYFFQTRLGISAMIIVMFSFFLFTVGVRNVIVPIVVLVASAFPLLSKSVTVFIQYGVEPIAVSGKFFCLPLFSFVGIVISILMFYEIFRRRVRA